MLKKAENELIRALEWLCTDVASTTHLNRFKVALGRTDTEGTMGINEQTYPGDPGPQTDETAAEPTSEPTPEPTPEAAPEAAPEPEPEAPTEEPAAEAAPTE